MTQEGTGRQRRLVLASASPRRQQLLREAGYEFAVSPANIDEDSYLNLMPIESCRCVLVRQRGHRPDVDAPALHTRLFNIEQAGSFGAALLVIQ